MNVCSTAKYYYDLVRVNTRFTTEIPSSYPLSPKENLSPLFETACCFSGNFQDSPRPFSAAWAARKSQRAEVPSNVLSIPRPCLVARRQLLAAEIE